MDRAISGPAVGGRITNGSASHIHYTAVRFLSRLDLDKVSSAPRSMLAFMKMIKEFFGEQFAERAFIPSSWHIAYREHMCVLMTVYLSLRLTQLA